MRRVIFILLWTTFSCKASSKLANSQALQVSDSHREFADEDAVRPDQAGRREIVSRAMAYSDDHPAQRGERSLLVGPKQFEREKGDWDRKSHREFPFNQQMTCEYLAPWKDNKPGGKTPKFFCRYSYKNKSGETKSMKLKVKYDSEDVQNINVGVYGETLATRLLWALGFPSDTVFPVQMRCQGCPKEPWRHITAYWQIHELEASLDRKTPGSETWQSTAKELDKFNFQFLQETLSSSKRLAQLQYEKKDGRVTITNPSNGEIVFDSETGIFAFADKSWSIYDPEQRRLTKKDKGGYSDLLLTALVEELAISRPAGEADDLVSRDFVSAVVEFKDPSIPVEVFANQGWSFYAAQSSDSTQSSRENDIRNVIDHKATQLQRQELVLLATFISHADNKDEQQRLICMDLNKIEEEHDDCERASPDPREKACKEGSDKHFESCDLPFLMMQDLGFTMGFGAVTTGLGSDGRIQYDGSPEARWRGTADPEGFLAAPIFKKDCVTTVNYWATGGPIEEAISEEARVSLYGKLEKFASSDQDLGDWLRSSRLYLKELRKAKTPLPAYGSLPQDSMFKNANLGIDEGQLIETWKKAFRAKVALLGAAKCPG
jgi:hypothetical protein